ncbi:protein TFG-like [Ostrea edulis]|uniref:protein TFG-like n=1 Tax=Ostrea edulis TaxID=37623 RepID=UPI0024AF99EC|nr:protein TFG-like [Ostrea edulis]XP_048769233.2 protein TFG-like [Ostrea edulis]
MDLSGKLIIKVQLGDDIRRIPIHNEDITYDELVLMMQRVFRGKLNNDDDILIKYKDEDQDLVTIFDDSDLSFAIQCSRILKITLFVNGQNNTPTGNGQQLTTLRKELRQIRDRVTQLLDQMEVGEQEITSSRDSKRMPNAKDEPVFVSESRRRVDQVTSSQPRDVSHSKEFDPYSSQKSVDENSSSKVMSSFGMSGQERSGTPDSISSIGSATNQKQNIQPSPTPTNPVSHPSAFVSPQPSQSLPQRSTPQQHPGQPSFNQQPMGYQGQQPGYGQQAPGFPGGPQQQAPPPQPGAQQRPFQNPSTSQPERQPSPMTQGMPPGQPGMPQGQQHGMPSGQPAQGMPPGQVGQPGMPQGQQQGMQQGMPHGPPQPTQGVPPGQPGYPPQQGTGNYGYGQYGGQGMPQPGQGQMPPASSSASWNQQQQGMFQGGYAGQPQPGGTPPSSAGSTPANQSNPYARPGGQGPFSGYPKPAQNYPNYNK